MSMELMVKAMKIRVGNPLRKLVLIKLADNASDQGECWPSYQHIADQCEISKRSVMNHIAALCESGLVKKVTRKGEKGNSSNIYLLQPHHQLVASYDSLNRKYSELLDEFKSLRRYFSVSVSVPYTDVWMHKPVQFYPGKHPCEKPADMLRQIINASSRPGDLVADFFMGSGSTIKAAMALGRRALGVELESERFNQTVKEINELVGK